MATKLLHPIPELLAIDNHGVFSHFSNYTTGDKFTTIANDGGSVAVIDGAGGILKVDPGSDTTNDQSWLKGTVEQFLFAADKTMHFQTKAKMTATAKATVAVFLGVKNAVADDDLADTTGIVASNFSGAAFYKRIGESYWRCVSSIGTTQTDVLTSVSAVGGAYQKFEIGFQSVSSTKGRVSFKIDNVEVGLNDGAAHEISFASATEMQVGAGVKDGLGGNLGLLYLDYLGCWQVS